VPDFGLAKAFAGEQAHAGEAMKRMPDSGTKEKAFHQQCGELEETP